MFLSKKARIANRRGYLSPPVVIVLAAIVAFVALAFYLNAKIFSKPQSVQTAQSSSSSGEMGNWKTYTGTNYQFRYPSNWGNIECSSENYKGQCFLSDNHLSAGGDVFAPVNGFLITVVSNKSEQERLSCPSVLSEEHLDCKDGKVGELPALNILSKSNAQIPGGLQVFNLAIHVLANKNLYVITATYPECELKVNPEGKSVRDCSNKEKVVSLFNQILSTFRFE